MIRIWGGAKLFSEQCITVHQPLATFGTKCVSPRGLRQSHRGDIFQLNLECLANFLHFGSVQDIKNKMTVIQK